MARNSLKNVMRLIEIANNNLSTEEQFVNDLKVSIEKANNEVRKPSQTIKPSSFNCIRNAYYQLIGETPDESKTSFQMIGICDSGSDRHIRMQKAIEQMHDTLGIDCEYIDIAEFIEQRGLTDIVVKEKLGMETKLYNKRYNMSFMTDGIVKYKGKYYIFEFKTETADKFYKRQGVDESHYNQAICYSLNFKLDDVIFLYENRNTLDLKCYLYHVTDEMRQDIIGKITICENAVKEMKAPPKPENVLKKTCTYCTYRNICMRDEECQSIVENNLNSI